MTKLPNRGTLHSTGQGKASQHSSNTDIHLSQSERELFSSLTIVKLDTNGNLVTIGGESPSNIITNDGSTAMEANLNLNSHKIINISTPENDNDASTKKYVDDTISTAISDLANSNDVTDEISQSISGLATETYVDNAVSGLASETYVDDAVNGLASESYVSTSIANLASTTYVDNAVSGITIESLGGATKSKKVSATISTTWTGSKAPYRQTISVSGVTPDSVIDIMLPSSSSDEEITAYQNLLLQDGGQSTNEIYIRAFGTLNTISIPILVIIRGDL